MFDNSLWSDNLKLSFISIRWICTLFVHFFYSFPFGCLFSVKCVAALRLIDYFPFYVPLKNFSLRWRRHHCWWRAEKFRPLLGAQGLWAGKYLYRATPTVKRDLAFCGLIRRTAPFIRLLRHAWGCIWPFLTWVLTGHQSINRVYLSDRLQLVVRWQLSIFKFFLTSTIQILFKWCKASLGQDGRKW
jgi:hypothetical protein